MTLDTILKAIPHCAIKWGREIGDEPTMTQPEPARIDEESRGVLVTFSAEDGDGVADYWRYEINADLEAWADKFGSYFEWENPGAISVFFEGVQS
jgi:hypothetical protein